MPFRAYRVATFTRCSQHRFSISLTFSSLPQYQPHLSPQSQILQNFLPWLEKKASSTISSSLSIANSSYGNSLFASNSIQTGDCILQVPYSVQITADNLPPEITTLIGEDVGNIAKLATVLLIHKNFGQDSEWHPYISCLPPLREMHNTIFWNESELEMIRGSSVYQETVYHKSQIEKDFLAIRPVLKSFCQSFGDFTCKDFMHACTLVGSRAWGGTKGLSLIPFADFLNHDGISEAIVMSDDDKQCSEVTADRDYVPGEQVLIRYGKFSNATLMLDFGFTIPHNIYDQVQIQLDIPKHDPLHGMKLDLLQQYFVPQANDAKSLKCSVNSFTIKEVKSARGKGKGVPQSLRALARILSCTTPQDLDHLVTEAGQTDGRLARRPLQDINKEIQSHQMLSSLFVRLIEERNTTLMSLDSRDSSLCERLPVRKQMAQDLLHGELRILKSASAWLENYCFSLT
ncbi:unnamed protein product [Lathyrus oleraceus]